MKRLISILEKGSLAFWLYFSIAVFFEKDASDPLSAVVVLIVIIVLYGLIIETVVELYNQYKTHTSKKPIE